MKKFVPLSLFSGLLLVAFAIPIGAQEKLLIIRETQHKNSPVVVVGKRIGDKRVDRKHEDSYGVFAGLGWIKNFEIDLKNISTNNVNYIDLDLVIPQTGRMKTGKIVTMFFGNRAFVAAATGKDLSGVKSILVPGAVVKVTISEEIRSQLEAYFNANGRSGH
jgi:hypothetical protein